MIYGGEIIEFRDQIIESFLFDEQIYFYEGGRLYCLKEDKAKLVIENHPHASYIPGLGGIWYDDGENYCYFNPKNEVAYEPLERHVYLSRRSLVEFRRRLAVKDPDMATMRTVFKGISKTAIKRLGLSTSEQRVDSTHIVSNICTRGRLDLFAKTVDHFIKSLDERRFSRIADNIKRWHQREPEGWFGLGLAQRKAKLEQLSKYLNKLIVMFKDDQQVTSGEPYQLLVRLFKEQCEVIEKGNGTGRKIKLKRKSEGQTLQSPYDPDASYGHKGKGYSAHIAETCNNKDKCEIITDYEVHGAAQSDKGKAPDIVDRLESAGLKPDTHYAVQFRYKNL